MAPASTYVGIAAKESGGAAGPSAAAEEIYVPNSGRGQPVSARPATGSDAGGSGLLLGLGSMDE